jgi:hypothetical protein
MRATAGTSATAGLPIIKGTHTNLEHLNSMNASNHRMTDDRDAGNGRDRGDSRTTDIATTIATAGVWK